MASHATLQTAYETLDRERQDLTARLTDVTRSRATVTADRDRLPGQLATAHATIASRDAEVAALKVEQEAVEDTAQRTAHRDRGTEACQQPAQYRPRARPGGAGRPPSPAAGVRRAFGPLGRGSRPAGRGRAGREDARRPPSRPPSVCHRPSNGAAPWMACSMPPRSWFASSAARWRSSIELQEELKVEAARNSPIAISEMSRFKVGEGIAGWALSHREPVLVRDSRTDARFKASDPKHQPRSFVAVPLLADKEGLGVLTLARSASDPFTDHDLRNLARVATDAANALINARLVDLLKQREDRSDDARPQGPRAVDGERQQAGDRVRAHQRQGARRGQGGAAGAAESQDVGARGGRRARRVGGCHPAADRLGRTGRGRRDAHRQALGVARSAR